VTEIIDNYEMVDSCGQAHAFYGDAPVVLAYTQSAPYLHIAEIKTVEVPPELATMMSFHAANLILPLLKLNEHLLVKIFTNRTFHAYI
jgi:hypothetical protein